LITVGITYNSDDQAQAVHATVPFKIHTGPSAKLSWYSVMKIQPGYQFTKSIYCGSEPRPNQLSSFFHAHCLLLSG